MGELFKKVVPSFTEVSLDGQLVDSSPLFIQWNKTHWINTCAHTQVKTRSVVLQVKEVGEKKKRIFIPAAILIIESFI